MSAREQIVALRQEGMSEPAIVERLKVTPNYVTRILRQAGFIQSASAKHASFSGANLADPNRADRLLRRFSWEAAE